MHTPLYILNNRFCINTGLNSVTDQQSGKESRLEPRQMAVLSFLTERVNQLVTREELVKEIWNDYGGGDEGLNQAISFLRKLLDDNNKEIIETIPKKGYVIHAVITEKPFPIITQSKNKLYRMAGLLCLFLIAIYFIYSGTSAKKTEKPDNQVNNKINNSADMSGDSTIKKNPDRLENKSNISSPPGADVLRDSSIKRKKNKSGTKRNLPDSLSGADVLK